ncbi:MAG: hypothetical protein V7636_602, partial [Actinomycetota bacterium]
MSLSRELTRDDGRSIGRTQDARVDHEIIAVQWVGHEPCVELTNARWSNDLAPLVPRRRIDSLLENVERRDQLDEQDVPT